MEIDELLAREAIRKTATRYHLAGDRGDADGFAACFTIDGVLDSPGLRLDGRDAIRSWMASGDMLGRESRRPGFIHHHLATHGIEMTGTDTAEGRAYFAVYSDVGSDHCGIYVDGYRRVDGDWLIAARKVRTRWRAPGGFAAAHAPS